MVRGATEAKVAETLAVLLIRRGTAAIDFHRATHAVDVAALVERGCA